MKTSALLLAIGLAAGGLAASTGVASAQCNWSKSEMTMAEVPVVEKKVEVAEVKTDLWLLPYLS